MHVLKEFMKTNQFRSIIQNSDWGLVTSVIEILDCAIHNNTSWGQCSEMKCKFRVLDPLSANGEVFLTHITSCCYYVFLCTLTTI